MKLHYEKLDNSILQVLLEKNKLARKALVYLVDFKRHRNLQIKFKTHSIEIFNDVVSVSILLSIEFEESEYLEIKQKSNFHIICFNIQTLEVCKDREFIKNLKWVDTYAWFNNLLEFAETRICCDLKTIKGLNLN